MSKRTDNISRFISSTRTFALVQVFVGLAFLAAASAGTYLIYEEIRADRMASAPASDAAPQDGVSQAEHDDLLRRVNEDYQLILKQNGIIEQQNQQINAGNTALNECRTAVANQSCPPQQACPEPVLCPAPVNTRPLTDRIKALEADLAACTPQDACPAAEPPCTYQGVPCLEAIAVLQTAIENNEKNARAARDTAQPCEIDGVPCEKLIAEKDRQIAALQNDVAAAREARNGLPLQLPEELQKLDAEQLRDLIKLLEMGER